MKRPCQRRDHRSAQSLVEFAVVALVLYMLLAAILTFGHALYVAQGLQGAADLAAREISRTPLPADMESLDDEGASNHALQDTQVINQIYDPSLLVYDLESLNSGESFFEDVVPFWPTVNQQLATLMIADQPDFDGDGIPDANLIRYPGALLRDPSTSTGYTVGIPLVSRDSSGNESIRWIPIVEEIEPDDVSAARHNPFDIENAETRGIVALRINYPFQSASMSGFQRQSPSAPTVPATPGPINAFSIANPNAVDTTTEIDSTNRPGELINQPLISGDLYAGTYGGTYGLGAQGALGQTVRPFRRVISAQAIYRREVFQ